MSLRLGCECCADVCGDAWLVVFVDYVCVGVCGEVFVEWCV